MSALAWVGVGALGGAGAIARTLVDGALSRRGPTALPLGTLWVNLTGAALLGLVIGAGLHGDALLVVGTGALGSYTTFATWMLESHRLAQDGRLALAATNVVFSLAAGIGAVALGRALGAAL